MLIVGIVAVVIWACFYGYSKMRLRKIPDEFLQHSPQDKPKDIKRYVAHLRFVKVTRFMFEKVPYIIMGIILVIVSGPFGVLVILLAVWFKSSLKDTNYRGYRSYANAKKEYIRQLDEWVVIANQTILK